MYKVVLHAVVFFVVFFTYTARVVQCVVRTSNSYGVNTQSDRVLILRGGRVDRRSRVVFHSEELLTIRGTLTMIIRVEKSGNCFPLFALH